MSRFKNLKVWQESKHLAVTIYRLTERGKFRADFGFRDQIRRAAISVSSNIAEGDELSTNLQSIRHFYIAKGSSAEILSPASSPLRSGIWIKTAFRRLRLPVL